MVIAAIKGLGNELLLNGSVGLSVSVPRISELPIHPSMHQLIQSEVLTLLRVKQT